MQEHQSVPPRSRTRWRFMGLPTLLSIVLFGCSHNERRAPPPASGATFVRAPTVRQPALSGYDGQR